MVEYGGKDELWRENTDGALKEKEEEMEVWVTYLRINGFCVSYILYWEEEMG